MRISVPQYIHFYSYLWLSGILISLAHLNRTEKMHRLNNQLHLCDAKRIDMGKSCVHFFSEIYGITLRLSHARAPKVPAQHSADLQYSISDLLDISLLSESSYLLFIFKC